MTEEPGKYEVHRKKSKRDWGEIIAIIILILFALSLIERCSDDELNKDEHEQQKETVITL